MKFRIVWALVLAALLLGAAGAGAASGTSSARRPLTSVTGANVPAVPAAHGAATKPSVVAPSPLVPTVLYDQYNNAATTATSSQNFEPANDAFDDELADDFVVPAGQQVWTITQVNVQGQYFNGTGPADSFNVQFYTDAATFPGSFVDGGFGESYTDTSGNFSIALSSPITLSPGTYWMSVQANQDFTPNGQWGWQDRTVQSNSGAAFRNPGGGFGAPCIPWVRKNVCVSTTSPDQVFKITGTTALPEMSISNARRVEGDAGTTNMVFTVSLNAPAPGPITAHYATANGTGTAAVDYLAASGTVSFSAGNTSKTISVPVVGDKLVEADETFVVNLSAPTAAHLLDSQGQGTIVDDDGVRYATATPSPTTGFFAGTVDIGNHCDDCSTPISLPFPVRLYGATYTSANVSSNGVVAFSGTPNNAFTNQCLPYAGSEAMLAPYWDDQRTDMPAGTGIFTSISGVAPNRVLNIEWRTSNFTSSSILSNIYEVRLAENSPNIRVVYSTPMSNGASATIGVQRTGVGQVTQFSCNSGTPTAPNREVDFNALFAPAATTLPASNLTPTGARLNASVNPQGQATTFSFQYGTTTAYGGATASLSAGAGSATVPVLANIGGLTAGTLYHYRVIASNATGTRVGADQTFRAATGLTVSKTGNGAGKVTSAPAGVSCPTACLASFLYGTSVTLTATPGAKAIFSGWSGDCTGTSKTCALSMTASHAATAKFTAKCVVPKVVGKTLKKARARIKKAHCRVGKITKKASTKKKKGRVLKQKPKPGKILKPNAKVNLTVGKGGL
jgi:hypothetical protein